MSRDLIFRARAVLYRDDVVLVSHDVDVHLIFPPQGADRSGKSDGHGRGIAAADAVVQCKQPLCTSPAQQPLCTSTAQQSHRTQQPLHAPTDSTRWAGIDYHLGPFSVRPNLAVENKLVHMGTEWQLHPGLKALPDISEGVEARPSAPAAHDLDLGEHTAQTLCRRPFGPLHRRGQPTGQQIGAGQRATRTEVYVCRIHLLIPTMMT